MRIVKIVYLYHNDLIIGYQTRFLDKIKYPHIDMFNLTLEQRIHVLEAHKVIYKSGRYEKEISK